MATATTPSTHMGTISHCVTSSRKIFASSTGSFCIQCKETPSWARSLTSSSNISSRSTRRFCQNRESSSVKYESLVTRAMSPEDNNKTLQGSHVDLRSGVTYANTSVTLPTESEEASQSSLDVRNYEVFLCFRGADIRKGFTDHLYHALVGANIHTFKDDMEIQYSQDIGPTCLKAIEESKVCIVVFSQDFASSTWCLEELEHILKFKKPEEIYFVFYDVDPSDVENQTGSFRLPFWEHTINGLFKGNLARVKKWRMILSSVVNYKALLIKDSEDGHEERNIKDIVEEILEKLGRVKLNVAIHQVDLDRPTNEVVKLLDDSSNDIRIVGIYGMPGIGKTTIAKRVCNCIEEKFAGTSFLDNISEKIYQDRNNIVELQSQLLSDILKREFKKINTIDRGLSLIKERLRGKKILIFLDGLDESGHLQQVIGDCKWLCPGSRVIITTRIKDYPNPNPTEVVYKQYFVKKLDPSKSLELLCLNAFGKTQPPKKYVYSAQQVLLYADGNPLALIVLGSSLNGEGVSVWNSRLDNLKKNPR